MSDAIRSFKGKYSFLSNFYPCIVVFEGRKYPSVEHAFQAAKTLDEDERINCAVSPSAADARTFGRHVKLRPDWEDVKVGIMTDIVRDKFTRNLSFRTDLKELLLSTGDAYLEEGNSHRDRFWGTVDGEGRNELGKILMQVREELRGDGRNE